MSEKCKECGCVCKRCNKNEKYGKRNSDIHLHAEIENLRQNIIEKNNHIAKMETQCLNDADKFPNGELASIKEELRICQDKFTRLFDAHKRIQKINQNLEDKLLKIVDKCETEKGAFTKDIATLSHRLADANYTIHRLSQDNSKYRNDVNLAIQLLQCKPSNFVGQKYDTLPTEVQAKVKTYISQKRRSSDMSPVDVKSITVPISTFPPTAMVYNISKQNIEKHSDDEDDDSKPPVDIVSAAIMAKVLEDRERERIFAKHCDTCVCHKTILMVDSECQTTASSSSEGNSGGEIPKTAIETTYNKDDNNYNKLPSTNQINGYTPIRQPTGIKHQNQSLQKLNTMIKQKTKLNKSLNDSRAPLLPRNSTDYPLNINNEINDNPVDIINDRIWKNSWMNKNKKIATTTSSIKNDGLNNNSTDNETHIDVINDRVWKNDNNDVNKNSNNSNLTLIEVKNINDGQLQDTATSPSFSSDSIVISSSEPSSISSDLLHSNNIKINKSAFNINNNYSQQQRTNRELLKKNILLDNARSNYNNAIVYTSSGSMSESPSVNCPNKSTTALVHSTNNNSNNNNNMNVSKSIRSLSISSDEAFPVLPHDATQLQRVAEWVQSSVNTSTTNSSTSSATGSKIKPAGFEKNHEKELAKNKLACTLIEMPSDVPRDFSSKSSCFTSIKIDDEKTSVYGEKIIKPLKNKLEVKDLISFDSTNEDEDVEMNSNDTEEVKITKEMEETYLKLAASLDPVSLSLSTSCTNPDLTIEKYRKDHRKNQVQQKINDKTGSTT